MSRIGNNVVTPPAATFKNDWRLLLVLFSLASVIESQSFGHFNAFTPLFLRQLHVPSGQISGWTGYLSAIGFVIGLPLLPFWGAWADRYSRKLIIVRSAYIEGILFTIAALSPNVWVLAIARFLTGFIFGNTGIMYALLADVAPPKRLGIAIGIVSSGGPIGMALGPYIGGLIAQSFGIRMLLGFDGVISVAAGMMLTMFVREENRARIIGMTAWKQLAIAMKSIRDSQIVTRIFVLGFIGSFGLSLFNPFLAILIQHLYLGNSALLPGIIGSSLTSAGIAMAITTPLWGRLGDSIGRWFVLTICIGSMAVAVSIEAFAPTLQILQMAIILGGLVQGGISTSISALLATLSPEHSRGTLLSFANLPQQLSWFLGPIVGAGLVAFGLQAPFMGGAVFLIIAESFAILSLQRFAVKPAPNI